MNPPLPNGIPDDAEHQLHELVDSYIARLQAGDKPDIYELLRKHLPAVRDAADYLATIELLHGLRQDAPPDDAPADAKSQLGNRYALGDVLGKGHSAIVYQARDTLLGRDVAVKVLRADQVDDPDLARRFERDAQIAAKLRHPNIVPVHDYGNDGERLFLVMELIQGETLEDRLVAKDRPPLSPRESAELIRLIAEALDHAHQQSVIHRDVKPSNILLRRMDREAGRQGDKETGRQGDEGKCEIGTVSLSPCLPVSLSPLLTDFGLARQVNASQAYTVEGQVLGTPAYMPPEQARGESRHADAKSDVYSLGVVLYRLLAGRLPFEGTIASVLAKIVADEPSPVRRQNPAIPLDLQTICLKALEKEPADRFPTARDFADDLGRWLHDEPIRSRPPTWEERCRRFWRKRSRLGRGLVAAVALLFVICAVLAGVAWTHRLRADEAERDRQREEAMKTRETELRAETAAWAELSRVRQIINNPLQGRRFKAQEIIRTKVAEHRRKMGPTADKERLDLEIRSLLAHTLAVPDVKDDLEELKKKNLAIGLPNNQFKDWPVALHPSGEVLAIGTHLGPLRWKLGQPWQQPEKLDKDAARPRIWYSPDGKYLTLADGGLKVWDEERDQLNPRLKWASEVKVLAVAFDSTRKLLLAASEDGAVRSWSLPEFTLRRVDRPTAHPGQFTAAAFNKNATVLAISDEDGHVRLRPINECKTQPLVAAGNKVEALAWSPDGQLIAVGTHDGVVRLLQCDGTPLHRIPLLTHGVTSMVFSPDGSSLAVGHRFGPVIMLDVDTGEPSLNLPLLGVPWGFTPDGKRLAVGSEGATALIELNLPRIVRRLTGHRASVAHVGWSANSKRLVTLDRSFEVRIWDATGTVVVDFFRGKSGEGYWADNGAVALSHNGSLAAFASGGRSVSHVLLWDVQAHREINKWELPGGFEQLAGVGIAKFWLVREENEQGKDTVRTRVYELTCSAKSLLHDLRPSQADDQAKFFAHALTPDGRVYAWTGPESPRDRCRIEGFDVATGRQLLNQKHSSPGVPGVALSPSGRWLWLTDPADFDLLFDLQGEQLAKEVHAWPQTISLDDRWSVIHHSPDERRPDQTLILSRWPEGGPFLELMNDHQSPPSTMAFSPDGRYLAWGTLSGTLFLAEIATLEEEIENLIARMDGE